MKYLILICLICSNCYSVEPIIGSTLQQCIKRFGKSFKYPSAFKKDLLYSAYSKQNRSGFITKSITGVSNYGFKVKNIKIYIYFYNNIAFLINYKGEKFITPEAFPFLILKSINPKLDMKHLTIVDLDPVLTTKTRGDWSTRLAMFVPTHHTWITKSKQYKDGDLIAQYNSYYWKDGTTRTVHKPYKEVEVWNIKVLEAMKQKTKAAEKLEYNAADQRDKSKIKAANRAKKLEKQKNLKIIDDL